MSILYEILVASLLSFLLNQQEPVEKEETEQVKIEQVTEISQQECKSEPS